MVSLEVQPLRSSFGKVFMGAAGGGTVDLPSDDQFNLVSFLSHFEGANNGVNNAFDDGSANNYTVTAAGNVTQGSFGPFARPDGEWGVSFDGSGDYVAAAGSADWQFGSGNFTVEFWTYPLGTGNWVIAHGDGSIAGTSISWQYGHGTFDFYYGTSYVQITSPTLTLYNWQHIAVVRNGATITVYKNGTSTGTANIGSNTLNTGGTDPFYIGGYPAAGGAGINGIISNVRVVKGTAVYTGNFTPSTSKLTAITNTKLLTCQSNRFVDNSASGHAITPYGNPAVSAFGPFLTSAVYKPSVNGASAYMDGTGDYLSMDGPGTLGASANWCMECFFYCNDSDPGIARIMSVNEATDADAFTVMRISNNSKYEFYSGGGSSYAYSNKIGAANFNEWTHIAMTKSGTTVRAFVNGIKLWEATHNATNVIAKLITGWGYGSEHFPGYISDARFVNGSSVYTGNFTPPTAPLTAITNTSQLLNMANGQAIDSAAQAEWTATNVYDGTPKLQTAQKKIGTSSLYFDGSSSYYFPSGFLPDGTGDYTIEFWFRTSNLNENATIFVAGNIYFQFYQNNLYYWNGASSRIISGTISTDTWYHVAGVRSGTTIYLFLNGTSQGTTLTGITGAVVGGAGYMGGNTGSYKYTGYIDEMRISRFARYTSSFTPATEPFADKGR